MSEYRAILVSDDQREAMTECMGISGAEGFVSFMASHFDAAGDQPRWPWCSEHGAPMMPAGGWCLKARRAGECLVVDAIVVPLPEKAS